MFSKKLSYIAFAILTLLLLVACEGETVVETRVVEKEIKVTEVVEQVVTQIVEKEGQTIIETVVETQVIEKEKLFYFVPRMSGWGRVERAVQCG